MPDARSIDALNHRAAELGEEIAIATRKGWPAARIGELADIRQAALEELHGRAIEENAERFTGEQHPDYRRVDALPKLTQHEREA
jgi:hypothetical protein